MNYSTDCLPLFVVNIGTRNMDKKVATLEEDILASGSLYIQYKLNRGKVIKQYPVAVVKTTILWQTK